MERGRHHHTHSDSRGADSRGADLRGLSRLVITAVTGTTDLVEEMHRNIAGFSPIVGAAPTGRARGISGLVYSSVRGVSRVVGCGLDTTFALLTPLLKESASAPRRDVLVAALNGVLGDHLATSKNPLALPMQLRHAGSARSGSKLLVLVHGLCMSDLGWRREGHDHGDALSRDLGYTPIYLSYNSGRPTTVNGWEFAAILEELIREWPVPVSELVIVAHSMGGLVARSACHHARLAEHEWPRHLKKLVCLGTPHHGAPLERAGGWVDFLVELSPYTAPFARLGKIRSAGIRDLGHGPQNLAPLPEGARDYVIAASKEAQSGSSAGRLPGDGLVPVKSALGQHETAALTLPVPASRQAICLGSSHFDLLGSQRIYEHIHSWLAET